MEGKKGRKEDYLYGILERLAVGLRGQISRNFFHKWFRREHKRKLEKRTFSLTTLFEAARHYKWID